MSSNVIERTPRSRSASDRVGGVEQRTAWTRTGASKDGALSAAFGSDKRDRREGFALRSPGTELRDFEPYRQKKCGGRRGTHARG